MASAQSTEKRQDATNSALDPAGTRIDEIVVTAQKREERLQDVPIPVSVLSPDSLIQANMTGIRDYYSMVPGLTLQGGLGGTSLLVLRGLSTGGSTNPVTGVTIDDASYNASTIVGGGYAFIDLDPADFARIEVLRGPQGTLYGASSLGGLLKYVTTDPSFDKVSGRISMTTQTTENDNGFGYGLRASVNVPLGDTVAIRASGFTRHDNGFVDDPVHSVKGLNAGDAFGGRLTALWRPSETFSVKLSAMRQVLEAGAADSINSTDERELTLDTYIPGYMGATREVTFMTGTVDAELGNVDLTSITSYTRSGVELRDSARFFDQFAAPLGGNAAPYSLNQRYNKFSQEVRVRFPLGQHFELLAGAFYTNEKSNYKEYLTAADALTGNLVGTVGNIFNNSFSSSYDEMAAFTTLTVRFTDKFDIQLGGRFGRNEQEVGNTLSGSLTGLTTPFVTQPAKYEDDAFTYLISPRLKLTRDIMLYARLAQGYRPGGPNYNVPVTGANAMVQPDTTSNYEIGVKGDIFGRLLSVDASVYRIDWKDVQLTVFDALSFTDNAGTAKSEGVELALESRPIEGLRLSGWAAWSDARLESLATNAQTSLRPGDTLPFSAPFSGHLSADYQWPLSDAMSASVGAALSYIGERGAPPTTVGQRPPLPAYTQVNVRAGFESDGWGVNAFINNVGNERGITNRGGLDGLAYITKPRTVGVSFDKSF